MGKLSKMQTTLLHMFDAFHSLCEDNGLIYYALGGTMLGAVRHGGFIPWDDDIDVGMPRNDYNKLRQLMGSSTFEKVYVLETPESGDSSYCFPYSKLYDTSTTLIENSRQQLVRGVYIDIFPLDGIANTEAEAVRRYKKIKNRIDLLTLRKLVVSSSRSSLKNAIITTANIIPENILNTKRLSCDIDVLCSKYSFDEYKLGGNLMGAWGIKEIMPREVFGEPQKYSFEGLDILGVQDYKTYLTRQYGNWKELPPIDKRITHHDYYLDLEKGYKDY